MANEGFNTRALLLELGIGDYNASMILPYMFMGPAQTDPAMAAVRLMTKAIQKQFIAMGATWLKPTGMIDDDTAHCLHALVGAHWNEVTWQEIITATLAARRSGRKYARPYASSSVALQGIGLPALPDVPGGIITYGIVGYLLYRHFRKKGP
jgi:hypothetical protein